MIEDTELLQDSIPYRVYSANRIIVTVGKKKVLLRWTPSQYARYLDLIDRRRQASEDRTAEEEKAVEAGLTPAPRNTREVLTKVVADRFEVLEIAFNPDPDTIAFSREELAANLDHNHAGHLVELWTFELFNPGEGPNGVARLLAGK